MNYREKMSLLTIATTLFITAIYYGVVYQKYQDLSADANLFDFWATVVVLMVPIYIAVHLLSIFVFTFINKKLTGEGFPKFTDERDKLIELKAVRGDYFGVILGIFSAMLAGSLGASITTSFVLLITGMTLAGLLSNAIRFYLYRKGA